MSIFGTGRLITSNATVDVQKVSVSIDGQGGTVESFTDTIASNVPVLITRLSGGRASLFNTDAQQESGTISGVADVLRTQIARYRITSFPSRPEMVNKFLRVTSAVPHPKGEGGILEPRITLQYQLLQLPVENTPSA
jgi:ribosomal protein S9